MTGHIARRQDLGDPFFTIDPGGGPVQGGSNTATTDDNGGLGFTGFPFSITVPNLPPFFTQSTSLSSTLAINSTSSTALTTSTSTSTLSTSQQTSTTTTIVTTSPTPIVQLPPSTAIAIQTSTALPPVTTSSTPAPAHNETFLQNKALSGSVFAIVAILILALILTAITWTLRKARKRDKLESISFDPDVTSDAYGGMEETGLPPSRSSQGHDVLYEPAVYPNYGPSQYPVIPEPSYNQGWVQSSAFPAPPSLMPGYRPTPQTQYPFALQPSRQTSGPAVQPIASRMRDTLPPLPTGGESDASYMPTASAQKDANPASSRIPLASPLPDTFGSDLSTRASAELDAQFWSRTLKVANA